MHVLIFMALISPLELTVVTSAFIGFVGKIGLIGQAFKFFVYLCNALGLNKVLKELCLYHIGLKGRCN